jgi:4-amino-4-deoxy-L-arabinose transferase-like glycosyltransferase
VTSRVLRLPRYDSLVTTLVFCITTIVILAALRGTFAATVDLRVDEAYYWTWSKENVISYLDHPPVVAWCVRAGTWLFGDTNFGVRFAGLASMLCMQLLLADIVRRVVQDFRYVVIAVLLPDASLHYGLGMAKVTPDIALIPLTLAMIWSLVRLWQTDDLRWWLLAGFFAGFAALSKYTVILLLPAVIAFAFVPKWRGRQLRSPWFWLSGVIAIMVASPMILWNGGHDWVSFRFQLDRPDQVAGWSTRFLVDFLGQQFLLVGLLLLPIVLIGTVMLAIRGYRNLAPVPILLSTATIVPFGFFLWHGVDARVGDSWLLFAWPIGFLCATINLQQWNYESRSWLARVAPAVMVFAIASGIAVVLASELYYISGTANYLKNDDPIGKEAGFAAVVADAEATRKSTGATWFVTSDYRIYSMLRWHLKDAVPVVQMNERSRYIGFNERPLDGPVGLYVPPLLNRNAGLWDKTTAVLETVGSSYLLWRGFRYDTYTFQRLTGWKPTLAPAPGDVFYVASPN